MLSFYSIWKLGKNKWEKNSAKQEERKKFNIKRVSSFSLLIENKFYCICVHILLTEDKCIGFTLCVYTIVAHVNVIMG